MRISARRALPRILIIAFAAGEGIRSASLGDAEFDGADLSLDTAHTGVIFHKRTILSPDNRCGGKSGKINGTPAGWSCGKSNDGPCCSAFGFCGSSTAYCGPGCQTKYSLTGSCLAPSGGSTDSPDNTCGAGKPGNYKCHGGSAGPCCSKYGFCGRTADYCKNGCQSSFSLRGICSATTPSPDNTCGNINNGKDRGYACTAASRGPCCSRYGNCGSGPDYCEVGCQREFGLSCENISQNNRCGSANNGARCPSGKCCSEAGYCGTTSAFCKSPSCQVGMGVCDSDVTPGGTNTSTIARERIGNVPYGVAINHCTVPGKVALTFDDGPYVYTTKVLDVLAQYNAKATFFVTGINNGKGAIDQNSTGFPEMLRRMDREGHQIASHTWSHRDLSKIQEHERRIEMYKLEMALRNVIRKIPTYMRAPYFSCTSDSGCLGTMHTLGYHVIKSTVDTFDYSNNSPEKIGTSKEIMRNAIQGTDRRSASIIPLMHDIQEQTIYLTEYTLEVMKTNGWEAVTVGECLGDPAQNWYRPM